MPFVLENPRNKLKNVTVLFQSFYRSYLDVIHHLEGFTKIRDNPRIQLDQKIRLFAETQPFSVFAPPQYIGPHQIIEEYKSFFTDNHNYIVLLGLAKKINGFYNILNSLIWDLESYIPIYEVLQDLHEEYRADIRDIRGFVQLLRISRESVYKNLLFIDLIKDIAATLQRLDKVRCVCNPDQLDKYNKIHVDYIHREYISVVQEFHKEYDKTLRVLDPNEQYDILALIEYSKDMAMSEALVVDAFVRSGNPSENQTHVQPRVLRH